MPLDYVSFSTGTFYLGTQERKWKNQVPVHHSYFSIFYITYHSEDKGRQFGLKSRKRSEIAEQTTEYYTPFNEQHNDGSILIYRNGKNTDNPD